MEVVSWYVMMGIGQVVTLRLPASRLREVNRVLENTAWGSYRTEFYPTYDYKTIGIGRTTRRSRIRRRRDQPQAFVVMGSSSTGVFQTEDTAYGSRLKAGTTEQCYQAA